MVERSDIEVVKSNLDFDSNSSPERSFVCSMQTSKAFKLQNGGCGSMLVRGSFQFFPVSSNAPSSSSSSSSGPSTEALFVALCSPTVNRLRTDNSTFSSSFSSLHRLDMSFSQVSHSVLYYLGHSSEELTTRSWYSLIHPEDLSPSAESHKTLVQADDGYQLQMVLRLQRKDLSWAWIYIRANKEPQSISCTNYIISETEAKFLQRKINNDEAFGLTDSCHSSSAQPTTSTHKPSKCLKRQRTSCSQGEELSARMRRRRRNSWQDQAFVACDLNQEDRSPGVKSPSMFTPPYTPTSSSSSFTPSACAQSPSHSPPSITPVQAFDQSSFNSLQAHSPVSSSSSLSPSYDDFPVCTSDARLVPDCLSVSSESPLECTLHQDEYSLLDQPQGSSIVHHVPDHALPVHSSSLLTPTQSPTSQGTFQYSEREREEISTCSFPYPAPLSSGFKSEPMLDDCIFDSILNDLDLVTIKGTSRSAPCQMQQQQQTSPTPLGSSVNIRDSADQLTSGRMSLDQNNGLHQLNRYIHSSLQQGTCPTHRETGFDTCSGAKLHIERVM
ncbi:hypothetical protein WMY93_018977 [Mugilogobius chulae]|uniref:PAS domain-containing protein n=1 Tax=Mugilogobius chulae TaxID=88201 RepID=A0AAW0NLI9_9GOBI